MLYNRASDLLLDLAMRHLIVLLALLVITLPLAAQPIYKIVDEHGNVTYTDQQPSDDARPINLPDINVMRGDAEEIPVPEAATSEESPGLNFRILSPENNARIFTESDTLDVDLGSDIQIPPTAQIILYVNNVEQAPIQTMNTRISAIEPGENSLRAELQTATGRVLAETDTVTFTMEPNAR